MSGLPNYSSNINVEKKITPYIGYKVTKDAFMGNDKENKKVEFKFDLDTKIAFDLNNIRSGFQWFKGDNTPPEKKMDAWVNGACTPAPQPSAMMDANGEMKPWRRFAEIPCFNSILGTRLFNFDGVATYKSAQRIVAQWLENRSNQSDTVFLFKYEGIKLEVSERDKTRNLSIPNFVFLKEMTRPEGFEVLGTEKNASQSQSSDIPF